MKKASITEAKNRLSALIDGLKRGSPVLIVDRGRPVARLEPVTRLGEGEQDGRLSRLIREGIVRPGRAPSSPRPVRCSPLSRRVQSATLQPWPRCLPSDGTAGEVLGCLCDCAVAGCRGIDPTATGACCEGCRYARMVGIRSRMHFRIGSPRT